MTTQQQLDSHQALLEQANLYRKLLIALSMQGEDTSLELHAVQSVIDAHTAGK